MTYGRLAQLVEHLLDVQEVTGSSPVPSTTIPRPFGLGIFLWWTVQDSNSTAERSEGNQSPGGALVSARFPTRRNVYRDAGTVWGFFCGGRYRTRTATTTTAACGRNREELLGPHSDFSKLCQGAAEKSANATRKATAVPNG